MSPDQNHSKRKGNPAESQSGGTKKKESVKQLKKEIGKEKELDKDDGKNRRQKERD